MMYRTLLKLLIFEMVEKIARFESLVDTLGQSSDTVSSALIASLKNRLNQLKSDILSEKVFLGLLFSEKAGKEKEFGEKLNQVFFAPYQELCRLSRLLNTTCQGTVIAETYLFLQDVLADDFSQERAKQVVLFHPEGETPCFDECRLEQVILEPISLLHRNNPLGWVGLVNGFVNNLYDNCSTLESLRLQLNGPLSLEKNLRPLVTHGLALRLMGPAYYYYAVIEALLRSDDFFLSHLEPSLFYGLNHLNFTDKSLVIMHEATEKYMASRIPESTETAWTQDQVGEVLRTIEKVIPDRVAFSEKNFQRSLQLQERLGQEILLSGYNLYPAEEVCDTLVAKQNAPRMSGESFPIYEMLGMVTETPNTPREIINAGWVHKMERGPVWLYNTVNSSGLEGFDRLMELVGRQDHLLIKSIETSEVHRVLLCGL